MSVFDNWDPLSTSSYKMFTGSTYGVYGELAEKKLLEGRGIKPAKYAAQNLHFSFGDVSFKEFKDNCKFRYIEHEGYGLIPLAFLDLVKCVIHLALAIFTSDPTKRKVNFFKAMRCLEEFIGHLAKLHFENFGNFLLERANFHKIAYQVHLSPCYFSNS